jgi:hypothetical protein
VPDEPQAGVGQPQPPADALGERDAGLALQLGELLRDRARGERQRLGDRGDRAPGVQLAQQQQLAEVEHRSAQLTDPGQQASLHLNAGTARLSAAARPAGRRAARAARLRPAASRPP